MEKSYKILSFKLIPLLIVIAWVGKCQSEDYSYQVNIDNQNKQLFIESCFSQAPSYFYATTKNAELITSNIVWNSDYESKTLYQKGGSIDLPRNQNGCLRYTIESKNLVGRLNSKRFNQQHPEDFILSIGTWMWKPSNYNYNTKIKVQFTHLDGFKVSAPWKLLHRFPNQTTYLMEYTPDEWPGYVAFGRFEIETLKIGNSIFQLALINGKNTFNKSYIIEWIKTMTKAVASITGSFPIDETQVLLIIQKGSQGAVPWGQVNRGGMPGVLFVVNPERSQYELMQDWTAAHEFSHLLIPYTPEDRWFSEGFASYYQNITRARIGLLDEKTVWRKIIAGFKRGEKTANKSQAPLLKYANGRNLMQMYWGGAVIALKAELELHKQKSGFMNLSDVMLQLNNCCLQTRYSWSAEKIFLRMDKISETKIFSNLFDQEVMNKKFPDFKLLLKELGVLVTFDGEIELDQSEERKSIRRKIIKGY